MDSVVMESKRVQSSVIAGLWGTAPPAVGAVLVETRLMREIQRFVRWRLVG